MSVDFYVAVPAANWPTPVAIQQCMADHAYPVRLKRFPALSEKLVVTDGSLALIDGKDAYLEGELATSPAIQDTTDEINDRLSASAATERVKKSDVIMSFRVRSAVEMRAASYVISALIVCFDGFGFEPQGNTYGRAEFVQSLMGGVEVLKGL